MKLRIDGYLSGFSFCFVFFSFCFCFDVVFCCCFGKAESKVMLAAFAKELTVAVGVPQSLNLGPICE